MMTYQNQTLTRLFDRGHGQFSKLSFEHCVFDNCGISLCHDVSSMSTASHIELRDCTSLNCAVGPVKLSEINIHGLKTGDLMILWGAWFEHVRLSGKLGKIKINTTIHDPKASADTQRAFDSARESFYASIDWALDISDIQPLLFEARGIPSDKLILNKKTQVIISRQSQLNWTDIGALLEDAPPDLRFQIQDFIEDSNDTELLIVAPTGKPKKTWQPYVDAVHKLRSAGLAVA